MEYIYWIVVIVGIGCFATLMCDKMMDLTHNSWEKCE